MSTHQAFLEATYHALRGGALGPLSSTYGDVSKISLEAWLADPYLNSPALLAFLRLNPQTAGEFLVSVKVEHGRVQLLATNLRLWMETKDHIVVCLHFAELASYETRAKFGWNHVVTVRTKSGESRTIEGVPIVLSDDLAQYLISGTATPVETATEQEAHSSDQQALQPTPGADIAAPTAEPGSGWFVQVLNGARQGAVAAVGTAAVAHFFTQGKVTFVVFFISYLLFLNGLRRFAMASGVVSFVATGATLLVLLRHFDVRL
jgi:hypothetical protein